MSTSTIGQYFSNRVEELISEFTGHTLIFFKGFGLEQIRFLITHPNSLLDDASLLHDGFLDLDTLFTLPRPAHYLIMFRKSEEPPAIPRFKV